VLGASGGGSTEHFGLNVALVMITFSNSFASIGGSVDSMLACS
jgi:7-keto-8-aminopelargonate synthetase-like enzyme